MLPKSKSERNCNFQLRDIYIREKLNRSALTYILPALFSFILGMIHTVSWCPFPYSHCITLHESSLSGPTTRAMSTAGAVTAAVWHSDVGPSPRGPLCACTRPTRQDVIKGPEPLGPGDFLLGPHFILSTIGQKQILFHKTVKITLNGGIHFEIPSLIYSQNHA